jgi:homotetrameric cytidine deaminase
MNDEREARLLEAARGVRSRAYARYSDFPVGAAVLCSDGAIVCGANVENASLGLTVCAERSAVFCAVSAGHLKSRGDLLAVAVAGPGEEPITPCGACRQVINEFASEDAQVIMIGSGGAVWRRAFSELLPEPFAHED